MIVFPNCKINLGLRILRKRGDGFHDLETVFYPLQLRDALEMIPAETIVHYTNTGIPIECKKDDTLCLKAYQLLKNDFPQLPAVQIHLHKTIPIGAGLGGGSSDGAFALQLLNKKFNLGLSVEQLLDYALRLGSDCPFFIVNKPCFATGRGEFLEAINLNLSEYKIVLVNPGIHVSTSWAFTQITPTLPQKSIKKIIIQPIVTWKDELKNDFEEPVFKRNPEIKAIKEQLYEAGAIYSCMSGSGSVVYGIFKKEKPVDISFSKEYFIKELFC